MLDLNPAIRRSAMSVADEIKERLRHAETLDSLAPNDGGLNGFAGTGLLFAASAAGTCPSEDRESARLHLKRASKVTWSGPGLFSGIGGLLFSARQALNNDDCYEKLCSSCIGAVRDSFDRSFSGATFRPAIYFNEYDIMTGWAGTLIAVAEGSDALLASDIASYLDWIFKEPARWRASGIIANSMRHNVLNLSMAHGLAGVVSALVIAEQPASLVERCADVLIDLCTGNDASRWSAIIDHRGESWGPAGLAWCYGVAGLSTALYAAGTYAGRLDLCDKAAIALKGALLRQLGEQKIDAALCHGLMGIAVVCSAFTEWEPEDTIYSEVAQRIVQQIVALFDRSVEFGYEFPHANGMSRSPQLLDGSAGIALGLATLCGEASARWTQILGIPFNLRSSRTEVRK